MSIVIKLPSQTKTYQLGARLRHLAILAPVRPVVLDAHPVLIRRRLRKAILGLGMGPLLPHLMSSASREVELQGPSEENTLTRHDLVVVMRLGSSKFEMRCWINDSPRLRG